MALFVLIFPEQLAHELGRVLRVVQHAAPDYAKRMPGRWMVTPAREPFPS